MYKRNWSDECEEFRKKLKKELNKNKGKEMEYLHYMKMNTNSKNKLKIIELYETMLINDI